MSNTGARAIELPANQPKQFYRGGASIAELRGAPEADFGPEDWVASTTTLFGKPDAGLSRLPDGRLLRDAVAADPTTWLGREHVAEFGADTALLVKLLDAGQRLPVHCHPSNAFAATHLDCRHGKTEAWIVIGTKGANPLVYIGFRDDVPEDVVTRWVAEQDTSAMLGALNEVRVSPGDVVFVPAGVPHAIGAGVFIVELQQPTDFSVTLEWSGFLDNPDAGHLGLGYDKALGCVDRDGWGGRLDELIRRTGDQSQGAVDLFARNADPFFRADRLHVSGSVELDPSFAVLVVLEGSGTLGSLDLRRGSTAVVPHAAGQEVLSGDLVAVRCRPPLPSSLGS
ncbi:MULTISPECIES: class I mannose-6-phosphate isomerase [Actinosynnema]|uniref:class I mannose-6-phosphate isomerase n=1 Tax=Actinosynnema TaxID=40566 RepID=UPI0020A54D9C|nr:class I mannose-6-phosphate isomerase [Actinosynnema pretiosum]MCP2099320.1 mannose-6-phosphate isomerase [Actinosynnema pretiosum]